MSETNEIVAKVTDEDIRKIAIATMRENFKGMRAEMSDKWVSITFESEIDCFVWGYRKALATQENAK